MAEPAQVAESEALLLINQQVDEAIAQHDGDARQTVASLIHELELTRVAVSFGFSRGRHHRNIAWADGQ